MAFERTNDDVSFSDVPIDGAEIVAFQYTPRKRLSLVVFTQGDTPGREYDLHFVKPIHVTIDIAQVKARVVGHRTLSDSLLLRQVPSSPASHPATVATKELKHYRIDVENGGIDVVAESFRSDLVWGV